MSDIERTDTSDTTMAHAFAQAGFDFDATAIETGDDGPREESQTAIACEHAQLFGATPERDEFDPRDVWDRDDATDAVSEAFRILAEGVAPDGFQLADERESLLWGFVNCLDAQVRRLDRATDRLLPEMRDLERAQDGTEVKARELELITDRARNFGDRRDAFETMRDLAADAYRTETGDLWRPRRGSHTSARPGTSPPPPSTPATSSAPARTASSGRTCRRGPSSPSRAGSRSPTPAPSSPASTRPRRSTTTWCSCTAAARASSASRRSGPSATACTRWCASRTGTPTDAPPRSAATTSC